MYFSQAAKETMEDKIKHLSVKGPAKCNFF
nr:hypothetical protein [Alloscardovia theropitheci]